MRLRTEKLSVRTGIKVTINYLNMVEKIDMSLDRVDVLALPPKTEYPPFVNAIVEKTSCRKLILSAEYHRDAECLSDDVCKVISECSTADIAKGIIYAVSNHERMGVYCTDEVFRPSRLPPMDEVSKRHYACYKAQGLRLIS